MARDRSLRAAQRRLDEARCVGYLGNAYEVLLRQPILGRHGVLADVVDGQATGIGISASRRFDFEMERRLGGPGGRVHLHAMSGEGAEAQETGELAEQRIALLPDEVGD